MNPPGDAMNAPGANDVSGAGNADGATRVVVHLNGAARELAAGTTVAALIEQVAGSARGSAVVVDDAVVPRGEWSVRTLADGQQVELITAVQGG